MVENGVEFRMLYGQDLGKIGEDGEGDIVVEEIKLISCVSFRESGFWLFF